MKTGNTSEPVNVLRALCRYETHGGYVWAAVMDDSELVCVPCLRANYRLVYRETVSADMPHGWTVQGFANSGESESTEMCAHCGRIIWEGAP